MCERFNLYVWEVFSQTSKLETARRCVREGWKASSSRTTLMMCGQRWRSQASRRSDRWKQMSRMWSSKAGGSDRWRWGPHLPGSGFLNKYFYEVELSTHEQYLLWSRRQWWNMYKATQAATKLQHRCREVKAMFWPSKHLCAAKVMWCKVQTDSESLQLSCILCTEGTKEHYVQALI